MRHPYVLEVVNLSAAPRPSTTEERLTYLETMQETVSQGIEALNKKMDRVLEGQESRAGKEWVEKLETRIVALETEVRNRPTYLSAGMWSAVLALLGMLVGKYLMH